MGIKRKSASQGIGHSSACHSFTIYYRTSSLRETKPKCRKRISISTNTTTTIKKKLYSNHSGRLRTKNEAEQHTNRNDPCGHSRKLLTKMMNTEQNKRHPSTSDKN